MSLFWQAAKNPFVGEPRLLLAQLAFRARDYAGARMHAAAALSRMYQLATAWDKRRSFANWVGYARMLHLRASRLATGLSSLPLDYNKPRTSGGLALSPIREIVAQLP